MASSSSGKKMLHLQGLRGLAILSVVLFHFFPSIFKNGYLGVDIFFLLSGFLMTMMLDRMNSFGIPELLNFWYRRLKRILPLYYLATFAIILCLFMSSGMVQSANVDSAIHSVLLSTNLIRPTGLDGYFEKLGLAVDMFTHTWSLALEMQFYLIFPLIFIIYKLLPERIAPFFVFVTGICSLWYHIASDSFTSFNSVFARIWQFLSGMAAFYADSWFVKSRKSAAEDEEELIDDLPTVSKQRSSELLLLNIFVIALVVLLFIPQDITPLYARLNSILLSFVIVAYARNCCLENKMLVFVGEISYGWYLVHWPVYALLKMNSLATSYYLLSGILVSFLISIIVHFSFEKHYLSWSKMATISTVLLLLFFNLVALAILKASTEQSDKKLVNNTEVIYSNLSKNFDPNFFWPSDFLDNVVYGYENMTVEERIKLNKQYDSGDSHRTVQYCKNFTKTKIGKEMRCDISYNVNKTANQSLLIVGNSWAGNLMQPVAESCSHVFNKMVTEYQTGCNPLIMSNQNDRYGCNLDHMFLDLIKEMKPDVVMMLMKYSDGSTILKGTSPLNDARFKAAAERLKEWQKYVKKRILILDVFPWPKKNLIPSVIRMLQGKNVTKEQHFSIDNRYFILKQRVARLVAKCPKCRVFDFSTQFWFNGEFKLYDPKYLVSFVSTPLHLTPAGWVRVKPLLKYVCENA